MSKKTLCKNMLNTGSCKYGDKCYFSHDINVDVNMNQLNPQSQPKNPTKDSSTCRYFFGKGGKGCTNKNCPYFHGYCDRLQHVKTISNHQNEINNLVIIDNTKYISSDIQTFYVRFSENDEFRGETIHQDYKIGKLIYSSNKVICAIQKDSM